MHLNNRARDLLDKYSSGMAQQFGARDTSRYFSLNDPQENALRLALLESVEFLNMITCLDVDQLSGQVISVGSSVLHTGRSENGRFVRQVGVDGNDYSLVETDSCAALRWDLLSVWANAGKDENEFYNLVQAFTTQAFALDMLRIGFNGKSRAKTTNPTDNPNGEDVNIGWHERMKTLLGGNQIMTDPVVLDEAGDYKSLDAMASDLINAKIPAQFRNDPRLVVLVGADLVAAEQYRLYQAADRPTEKIAAQMLGSTIAGRPAVIPPFMPGTPVDRNEAMPPVEQIVHRQPVTRTGVVNENGVVYSAVLGADVGDFSFNWIGLLNKASGTLAMIVHAPLQQKLKTAEGQQGNVLTRSFLMEYNGAQTETGINTPAETWQIDFTARMAGMDERQRLENTDIYGAAAFFGDGWLVGKTGTR